MPRTDDPAAIDAFVERVGRERWHERMQALQGACTATRAGRARQQRHALEIAIDRMRRPGRNAPWSEAEQRLAGLAGEVVALADRLRSAGRARLDAKLAECVTGANTLVPAFHLVASALRQTPRGFKVAYAGLEDAAPFDLLLWRDGVEAEVACEVVSAEAGRDVHRGAWFDLVDRVDPDLQSWLASHPGRYLLKMTLPQGLKTRADGTDGTDLAELHRRITTMLTEQRRADHDEAAVLRLDPLMLAAAQAEELGLMPRLRREFGPEAHLAVTSAGNAVFVMAARASREDEVAGAVRRRMAEIAPTRLTGARPGILAMFIDDTDRTEWRGLRDRLQLEGEARHFLTCPEAKSVVAITCSSRFELLGCVPPDGAEEGELRFRNPGHKDCKAQALAPAVLSAS